MRSSLVPLCLAALLLPLPLRAAEDLRSQATADLKRYYNEQLRRPFIITEDTPRRKESPPPWSEPFKQLASARAEVRRQAVAYLRELVSLALQDERSGKAPWRNTPYWGGEADIPARTLRKEVADELARASLPAEAVPLLRWYLEHESMPSFLEPIVAALGKLDGKEADALRAELASAPHENAVVAAAALRQIADRKGTLPAERLAALCQHHRAVIRSAARKLNARQKGKDPGPFDPARAVRSEPVRKLMGQLIDLMTELPPARADFVRVTVRYRDAKKVVKETQHTDGWLVWREGDLVEVYTPYGEREVFRGGERKTIKHSERSPDGRGVMYSKIDVTTEVSVAPRKIDEEVKEVAASRAKNTASNDLSEQGPLTGQFRGSGATLYEAILGAWLYRAGRDGEAARVLLPALDTLYADHYLVEMVRHRLGEIHGYRMLVAFAGDRDYERALRQARLISERYPRTRFHEYAKKLAEQLPRRRDDFKKLRLPTPAEWADLKKRLTRDEQIDYLCERMRLLNCFQMGQPGGYFPGQEQYAEPCGMEANASWGLDRGKTRVINPLVELRGPYLWLDPDKPRPRGLELTLKDVPRLSKYLREDWFMLIVSFWRDFHPDRSLSSTRPQLAEIINGLAGKNVCKVSGWDGLTPEQIDREITRINRWAAANAGKSRVQLEWEALQEEVSSGAEWHAVSERVESLLKQKQARAYEVMRKYLESDRTDAYDRARILQMYREHDAARARDLAPRYLDAKNKSLRVEAALLVFASGEKSRAREILGKELATGEIEGWYADAVKALLEEGSAESRRQAARLFSNPRLRHERHGGRAEVLRRCARAGMKQPYEFYLPLLDINKPQLPMLDEKGKEVGTSFFEPTVAQEFAREIVEQFAADVPAVREIRKKAPKTAEQIPHLKKWLRRQAGVG